MGCIDSSLSQNLGMRSQINDLLMPQCEEFYTNYGPCNGAEIDDRLVIIRHGIPVQARRNMRQRTHYWLSHPCCQAAVSVATNPWNLRKRLKNIGVPEHMTARVTAYLWANR